MFLADSRWTRKLVDEIYQAFVVGSVSCKQDFVFQNEILFVQKGTSFVTKKFRLYQTGVFPMEQDLRARKRYVRAKRNPFGTKKI
jgi:hypothetical protein